MTLYDQSYPQKNVAFNELNLVEFQCAELLYEAGRASQRARCKVAAQDGNLCIFLTHVSSKDGDIVVYEEVNRTLMCKLPKTAFAISLGAFVVEVPGFRLKNIIFVAQGTHEEYFKDMPFTTPDHFG